MNPPPPPPHGEVPKGSGLPPGKYDIFVIPPHSAGSGFLYLPSLQPNVNSFAAGFASALILVALGSLIVPALQQWWYSVRGAGGTGMLMVMVAVGVGAWALGRTQTDGGPGPGGGEGGTPSGADSSHANGHASGQGANGGTSGMPGGGEKPKPTWQRTAPGPGAAGANTAKGGWEKAREETRKKEEERKAAEAVRKAKEEHEKKLKEAREKDAREREEREKKAREAEERERKAREEGDGKVKGSTYAYSAVGEKTNPWPRGAPPKPNSQPGSPTKRPPPPTARTYLGTEDDAYSFRPYDKPSRPTHKKSASSVYSEESYAASHSTARTTPPPSHRGPYSTKDPDKIVIKAVYAFTNAFLKTPTSQLVSGVGSVTDGLILRITTEGLFIDDDVRGVPQREWDVKAWTMKLVEVWCPTFRQGPAGNTSSARTSSAANPVRRLWNHEKDKAATAEEADALLVEMLQACKDTCRSSSSYETSNFSPSPLSASSANRANGLKTNREKTGELKSANLHVLRASIRDAEGKRYVFVVSSDESWKVAVGLQRLRKGTQVRALGVSTMTSADARGTLEGLGWG